MGKKAKRWQSQKTQQPQDASEQTLAPQQTAQSSIPPRVAVFGGDGRHSARWEKRGEVRYFPSSGNGGNAGARRLEQAVRTGGVDLVVILIRWNGHPGTKRIRDLCSSLRVPVESCATPRGRPPVRLAWPAVYVGRV